MTAVGVSAAVAGPAAVVIVVAALVLCAMMPIGSMSSSQPAQLGPTRPRGSLGSSPMEDNHWVRFRVPFGARFDLQCSMGPRDSPACHPEHCHLPVTINA